MKRLKLLCGLLILTATHLLSQQETIVIFFGLNDSHSKSWVRENAQGVVGISYFQHLEGSHINGALLYKAIYPDGSVSIDTVANDPLLEKSVLLFDASSNPHIFVARSHDYDQTIEHYWKTEKDEWRNETIVHFYNEGGKFIYELSADAGPDYSFHLLVLKTRSKVDSGDFMEAWRNSHLYHLTDATGKWEKELIHSYDTAYTYDMYIKSSCRQDMKIDKNGYVHVVFSEQVVGTADPSRLLYATNRSGKWQIEVASNYDPGSSDDAGWFPSLCLDHKGRPYVSCMYVNRVPTHSATDCRLLLLKRKSHNNWVSEIVASRDDGYYGGDGRNYTGGLSHLVFDRDNSPHIVFSDIASTHWPGTQRLNAGNIRYAVPKDGGWKITTIYRQPRPAGFFNATEMLGMCLVVSEKTKTVRVIGQELQTNDQNQYSCKFVSFAWEKNKEMDADEKEPRNPRPIRPPGDQKR
ncbi:MAG: hypothetical protein OEW18_03990 [Candidatus Aminicenantes bacterium]|nr:hypothetical protein [Candidatus Aminicenantes bacterium]